MSNNNNRMIVFASILGAILATIMLALNPSTITYAGAQMYGDHQYGYDNNHEKKSSHTDIQKISCVNSNINVNGIDITQIPEDTTATAAANEEAGPDAANTQNGNGFDKINFDRNLVNICVNVNLNEQLRNVRTCESCFTTVLSQNELNDLIRAITEDGGPLSLQELCDFIAGNLDEEGRAFISERLFTLGGSVGISADKINEILDCLEEVFGGDFPRDINGGTLQSQQMNWKSIGNN